MKYVALLRGINIGGGRKVPMAELKQLFAELGYVDIATYINSGNVIFSSTTRPASETIQTALEQHFGFPIDVLILSAAEIKTVAREIPDDWENDRVNHKSDVLYLFDDVNSSDIIDAIKPRPQYETLVYVNHAVLSNIQRVYQGKSSLLKLMGTPLYKRMTIRNVTTARKLAELVT
jgi:uncharacterized protein (DUF1697 family)